MISDYFPEGEIRRGFLARRSASASSAGDDDHVAGAIVIVNDTKFCGTQNEKIFLCSV